MAGLVAWCAACVGVRRMALPASLLAALRGQDVQPVRPKDDHAAGRAGRQALQRGRLSSQRREGLQGGRQEIRRGRPPAPLFRLGAQGADHVGLCLLRGAGLRRLDHRRAALRHPASRQPRRGLCAVPDRLVLFRSDPRRHARPGPHRKGDRRARRSGAQISEHRICR